MLRVTVAAVGSLKERYWRDACDEYIKRLGAYCKPEIIELDERRLPKNPSEAEIKKCVETEGEAMLSRLPPGARVIAMCIEGAQLSSEQLGAELARLSGETSHIAFVIGGSHGLSPKVKTAAARMLSMGAMTFPHQLARVMLLEQVYRGFSIAAGTKYHK